MRQFRTLSRVETDAENGVMYISGEKGTHDFPSLMVSREGSNVPISVSYGPIELALLLSYDDLARTIPRLHPVDGLITTRQVGSNSAFIAFGLQADGAMLIRPTLVSDAHGKLTFNLKLPDDAKQQLLTWLDISLPH